MSVRVAINGFGRIGRSVFRILSNRPDVEVVAINDLFSNEALAYLLQYDTVMGKFDKEVRTSGDQLIVDDRQVLMLASPDASRLPWKKLSVDMVVEATGRFRSRESLEPHLKAGARRVLLTVPPKGDIDAIVVMGVNHDVLKKEHRIISNASCTTNCLAPVAMVLDAEFGIEKGFMTTVHAYTNDQRLADVPHKDLRRSRAAAQNIIPTTTGAAKAVGRVLPNLQGRLDGTAMRVPVANGSTVDFTVQLGRETDAAAINAAMRLAAEGPLKSILDYCDRPIVSSDIIGDPHSSIFDALSTIALPEGFVKVVAWYDNEWGYSSRVVDVIDLMAALDRA